MVVRDHGGLETSFLLWFKTWKVLSNGYFFKEKYLLLPKKYFS